MRARPERWADWLLLGLCAALIALGLWLRARQLGVPEGMSWDEHHFVKNAQNYLQGRADWNDHPPLGKLLIAQSIRWLGDNAVGWRAVSFVSGVLSILFAGVLGASLFGSFRAALLSAAFVAGDGFFIAYSRTALLDGVVTTFVLATACAIVRVRKAWHVALASVLLGLGCAVKFNAVVLLPPLLVVSLALSRVPRWSVALIALAPLSYYLAYARGLSLAHQPAGPWEVILATKKLYLHHAALTEMRHIFVSKWFTWLVPLKPIAMRFAEHDGVVKTMTSMGNPLLWWAASASVVVGSLGVIGSGLRAVRERLRAGRRLREWIAERDRAGLWLLSFWWLAVLPWIVSRRDSYIYHYLPAYGFGVVLVAGHLARLLERRRRTAWAGIGLIGATSFWLAPVWSEIPISRAGYVQRLWFPGWRRGKPKPNARFELLGGGSRVCSRGDSLPRQHRPRGDATQRAGDPLSRSATRSRAV